MVSCDAPMPTPSLVRSGSGGSLLPGETTVARMITLDAGNTFTVDFGTTFTSLSNLQICILFGADLHDPGETWFINNLGGQFNPPSAASRDEALLNIPHQNPLVEFLDGVYSGSWEGPANPRGIMLVLTGVPSSPLPPEGTLSGPSGITFGPLSAGGSESRTATFTNAGGRDLLIGAIAVGTFDFSASGSQPTVYSLVSAPPTPMFLAPGASMTIAAAVTNATAGRTGRLRVQSGESAFCNKTTFLSTSIAAGVNPTANAGPDFVAQCAGPSGASVTLNGSASHDPDGTITAYEWRSSAGVLLATGVSPTITLPLGTHAITLKVTDNSGRTGSDVVNVTVHDTQAPAINLAVSSTSLWPPNHKMVLVATGIAATDPCCATPTLTVSVSSNEPVNGLGDGDTAPDWEVIAKPDGTYDVWVRAERSGTGGGRVYTIHVTATDDAGNSSSASATVTVPHSKKGSPS
jgi:hypothetical protein